MICFTGAAAERAFFGEYEWKNIVADIARGWKSRAFERSRVAIDGPVFFAKRV